MDPTAIYTCRNPLQDQAALPGEQVHEGQALPDEDPGPKDLVVRGLVDEWHGWGSGPDLSRPMAKQIFQQPWLRRWVYPLKKAKDVLVGRVKTGQQ